MDSCSKLGTSYQNCRIAALTEDPSRRKHSHLDGRGSIRGRSVWSFCSTRRTTGCRSPYGCSPCPLTDATFVLRWCEFTRSVQSTSCTDVLTVVCRCVAALAFFLGHGQVFGVLDFLFDFFFLIELGTQLVSTADYLSFAKVEIFGMISMALLSLVEMGLFLCQWSGLRISDDVFHYVHAAACFRSLRCLRTLAHFKGPQLLLKAAEPVTALLYFLIFLLFADYIYIDSFCIMTYNYYLWYGIMITEC